MQPNLVLASSSTGRLKLLQDAGLLPDEICAPDIDETPLKSELPKDLVTRLAYAKAEAVVGSYKNSFIITADSVSSLGRRVINKANTDEDVRKFLTLFSGRRHKFITCVVVTKIDDKGNIQRASRFVETILKFKCLTKTEIEDYVASKEGLGKSGGYAIQGKAAFLVSWISGSFSNIVGLPLFETNQLLKGLGYEK